jgi:hypothetical protein
MVKMEISNQDIKMLRDIYNKSGELLKRLGFGLDGNSPTNTAVKKEPNQKQRIKNYDEILSSGKKNSKPKHLLK